MNFTEIKNLPVRINEVGRIKIGQKGKTTTTNNGKSFQPPRKLNHFLVTKNIRGEDGNFIVDDEIMKKLGNTPTEIPVMLLFDEIALNFQARYSIYSGTKCILEGDGEKWRRLNQKGVWEPCDEPTAQLDPSYAGMDKCKMNGTLSVVIRTAEVVGGVWKFRTTGFNSVTSIYNSLKMITFMTGGYLAGIPLVLTVSPKTGINPKTGDACQFNVVNIIFRGAPELLREKGIEMLKAGALYHQQTKLLEQQMKHELATKTDVFGDDPIEIIDEFYPEVAEENVRVANQASALDKLSQGLVPKPEPEPEPVPKSEPEPVPKSEPEPVPKSEPEPVPSTEIKEESVQESATEVPTEPEPAKKVSKPRKKRETPAEPVQTTIEEPKPVESPKNDVSNNGLPITGVIEESLPKTTLEPKEQLKIILIENGLDSEDLRHTFYKKYPMSPEDYVENVEFLKTNIDNFKKTLILTLKKNVPTLIEQLKCGVVEIEKIKSKYEKVNKDDFRDMMGFYADLKRSMNNV